MNLKEIISIYISTHLNINLISFTNKTNQRFMLCLPWALEQTISFHITVTFFLEEKLGFSVTVDMSRFGTCIYGPTPCH